MIPATDDFAIHDLSAVDELNGCILTYNNLKVIQNLKAKAASEALQINASFRHPELQKEDFLISRLRAAYLAGQIDFANHLQGQHVAASEELNVGNNSADSN